jgi:FKBP-type peptidyl-prolyl cis-trans isomerase
VEVRAPPLSLPDLWLTLFLSLCSSLLQHTSTPIPCRHHGIIYLDKKLGSGLPATRGDILRIHYIGRLHETGEIFDRSRKKDGPFEFKLGEREVIAGWDIGIVGMRMAGSRTLTIPSEKAYGRRGVPPDIPPYATLVFEIHVVEILRDSMTRYSLQG